MATGRVTQVRVGPQGRIVIPAALRRDLAIGEGDRLLARAEEGRLVLEKREAVLARLRKLAEVVPPDVDLADELIRDRRAEARREAEE